jgi:hypothetical protein
MGQIHFPPLGPRPTSSGGVFQFSECVPFGESVTLCFDDSGFFAYAPLGHFLPEFRMGFYSKGSESSTSVTTDQDGVVVLFFLDLESFLIYVETVTIKATCPKVKSSRMPKKP